MHTSVTSNDGGDNAISEAISMMEHLWKEAPIPYPKKLHLESRPMDYRRKQRTKTPCWENIVDSPSIDTEIEMKKIMKEGVNLLFRRLMTRKRSNSIHESNSQYYESVEIKHVRNELEQIRIHPSSKDSLCCSCRKRKNGGSHKKRMPERKLREELQKHGVSNTQKMNRTELEKLLHQTIEQQGCCYGDDCPCVHNGVGCQADTCSCWQNCQSKGKGNFDTTNEAIQSSCGNKFGMYNVDFDKIGKYRRQLIEQNKSNPFCAFIGTPS